MEIFIFIAAFIPPPPAPPPPPEMVAPVTRKFEVTSKVKMRPFHWNKVSALMVSIVQAHHVHKDLVSLGTLVAINALLLFNIF